MSNLMSSRSKKLIVLAVIALICVPFFVSNNVVAEKKDKLRFKLGALLPLTGPLASYGEAHLEAITLAVSEVQDLLVQAGAMDANDQILFVRDTEGNPDIALGELTYLYEEEGIQLVIGPVTSAEVMNIKEYADENKILVVSQSSTMPGAAIEDDFIFRFSPNDYQEARVIAQVLMSNNIDNVIVVHNQWADDIGILDIYESIYEEYSGNPFKSKILIIGPDATASAINADVDDGGDGVLFLGWGDETANVMTEARDFESLWSVRWFGISGMNVFADQLISNLDAAEFSVATGFTAPDFAPMKSFKYDRVHDWLEAELGREADNYAYVAYDIVWALTYAYSLVDESKEVSSGLIKDVLPEVTESLFGASGWFQLNEAGDRAFANYNLYSIEPVGFEVYDWIQVGRYFAYSDSLRWFPTQFSPEFLEGNQIRLRSDYTDVPVDEAYFVIHGWLFDNWRDFSVPERNVFLSDWGFELEIDKIDDGVGPEFIPLTRWQNYYEIFAFEDITKEDAMTRDFYVQFEPGTFSVGVYEFRGLWYESDGTEYESIITVSFVDS